MIQKKYGAWEQYVAALGFIDILSAEDGFASEIRTDGPWLRANESGIYTWITDRGEAYTGQAVKARSRLRQHWTKYRDIAYAAFKPVPLGLLDVEERRMIAAVEARYPVLNVTYAKSSASFVPFDKIVAPEQTQRFLDGALSAETCNWQDWPLLHRKQARRFEELERDGPYDCALEALRGYIERCIPLPAAPEVKFWSVTILNHTPHVFRVNAGQQEVFSLWFENELYARVLAYEKLSKQVEGPYYSTKSYVNWIPVSGLIRWLDGEAACACRKLIVWLMRHTTPLNSRPHCPQLVRAAFSAPPTLTSP